MVNSNLASNLQTNYNGGNVARVLDISREDDDWVAVKRRRIEDWIPPLPSSETISNFHNSIPDHFLHDIPPCQGVDGNTCNHPTRLISTSTNRPSSKGVKSRSKLPVTRNISSEKLLSGDRDPTKVAPLNVVRSSVCKTSSNSSRCVTQLRMMPGLTYGSSRLCESLRASNLDRKLRNAGGLDEWLMSIGLERFVKVFRARNIGKFQLVNMSMDKLKDMGAEAVGPRRKLMHAIDCLCHPPCFQAF